MLLVVVVVGLLLRLAHSDRRTALSADSSDALSSLKIVGMLLTLRGGAGICTV